MKSLPPSALWAVLVLLLVAALPMEAQAAVLDAMSAELFTWVNNFNTQWMPVIITVGLVATIVAGSLGGIRAGGITFVCCVLAAFAYGARTQLINFAGGGA
jgi:hypothetical protein